MSLELLDVPEEWKLLKESDDLDKQSHKYKYISDGESLVAYTTKEDDHYTTFFQTYGTYAIIESATESEAIETMKDGMKGLYNAEDPITHFKNELRGE